MTIKNMDGDRTNLAETNVDSIEISPKKHNEKSKYKAENIVEQFLEEGEADQEIDWDE